MADDEEVPPDAVLNQLLRQWNEAGAIFGLPPDTLDEWIERCRALKK